jgi:hypothetical protein
MCTYLTETVALEGSGKGQAGWFRFTRASVYVDHPYHSPHAHTLNVDLADPAQGPAARIALELTEEAARELVDAIERALDAAPPGLASALAP